MIELNSKTDLKITLQNGRQIPLQPQELVEKEMERLIFDHHIGNVRTVKDKNFLHTTVMTFKKGRNLKLEN